ncbi:FprA family A-type flavoprotein [candidate division WOR-3 bacterium]|jgi:flavorubredoxin|nr:FprA family A-type flavoprotein [candidate division WOR-3 bacterium]
MAVRKLKDGIYSVGAIDWNRRLFDELIPLPQGTTYNAYLIKGSEKIALIDTVDPTMEHELLRNLREFKVERIDYVISNHAEQDHSGSIPKILEVYPQATLVTNEKCKSMLMDLLLIPEGKFKVVNDKETLSLGDRTLEFILTPWVHWPETMSTYLREDKILFSCDFFGSHYASSELFVEDEAKVLEDAKRYYAEIMMPFMVQINRNLEKLKDYQINMIAPSHGPVYNKPELIVGAYKEWISDKVKNEVVIAYVSMHGSTKKMVDYLFDALVDRGIKVTPYKLTETDIGELAISLVDAATLVLGTPTVLVGPHPDAVYAAVLANALKPRIKNIGIIGSFGWGGKAIETIKSLVPNLKAEILTPVLARGHPKEEDYKAIDKLADEILKKHKDLNLI